jgi:hypothetical protein
MPQEEDSPVPVTQADLGRFLTLIDLLADPKRTKALASEAAAAQAKIDELARKHAELDAYSRAETDKLVQARADNARAIA